MGLCIEASYFLMSIKVTWDRNVIDQSINGAQASVCASHIVHRIMDSLILGTRKREEVDQ